MKYPSIGKQPMKSITIPELSGGMNLRDSISAVNDNQLTQCLNMWFKGGILKTRPGLRKTADINYDKYTPPTGQYKGTNCKNENTTRVKNGVVYQLISIAEYYEKGFDMDGNPTINGFRARFVWVGITASGEPIVEELPYISNFSEESYISYFTLQFKDKLYCFCETESGGDIYRYIDGNEEWIKLTDEDIYAPIVLTHCKTNLYNKCTGTQLEGHNLIGRYYRMIYSTVNKEQLPSSSDNAYHLMLYQLEFNCDENDKADFVKATITDKNGVKTEHIAYKISDNSHYYETDDNGNRKAGADGLSLGVSGSTLYFSTVTDSGSWDIAKVYNSDYVEDNLEITAPSPRNNDNTKKVFGMSQRVWFGGDAAGLSGGSRLFLGGNTSEKEKSLVLWSGLNNPLYFPENCYAYVGNGNQAVTAFGRQSDMLVVFKERETFLTQYVRNDNITAEALINQSVVDYTASNVYFPMIQLHAGIGCDCPDTVQLCRNCLVWACTNGNVYTLRSENQYSERTIFKVSDMARRELKGLISSFAQSADVGGKYYLLCGSKVFVMDYESYGYVYVSSYSKTEDAQLRIPWWNWELPTEYNDSFECIPLLSESGLMMLSESAENVPGDRGKNYNITVFDEKAYTDDGNRKIKSSITTKVFDFGLPAYTKNVPLVNIALGNNGGEPVTVAFVSDHGNSGIEDVILAESGADEHSPEFVQNRQLRPSAHGITRFGLKIECNGAMSIDGISLNYRILGGSR